MCFGDVFPEDFLEIFKVIVCHEERTRKRSMAGTLIVEQAPVCGLLLTHCLPVLLIALYADMQVTEVTEARFDSIHCEKCYIATVSRHPRGFGVKLWSQ